FISVKTIQRFADPRYRDNITPLSVSLNMRRRRAVQCDQFVPIDSYLEIGIPLESSRHIFGRYGQFESLIVDRAVISHRRRQCGRSVSRSEEHTSELQSRENLVC